ncbi:MAG: site-specific tyrosine recombinase XerD [Stackebrandtia sp.]
MVRDYLDHLLVERGHSKNTLDAYRRDLRRYADWLAAAGVASFRQIDAERVGAYIGCLSRGDEAHPPLAPRSAARCRSAVRGLHRFAVAEGVVDVDATADTVAPRVPMRLPKAISLDDVERLLEAAAIVDGPRGLRDVALLEFLYGTGARVSEAVGADVDDVDLDRRAAVLRGKGGKVRTTPLGSHAARALEAYVVRGRPALLRGARDGHPRLFVNARGRPLTRQGAHLILTSAADRAGLPEGIGPHTLRHSFATHLLDGGADVRVVQELLGHASVSTTQIYTLVTVDKLREVYATSHPRAR